MRQVHDARAVVVEHPGQHAGVEADAAVTATPGCSIAVRTADCAPVVLLGAHAVGVVHAGWRGLLEGVIDHALDALRALDDGPVSAHLGPCIRAGCYEFADPELEAMTARFGADVAATTTWGRPALDLPAVVAAALGAAGIDRFHDDAGCTACDRRWYSHRARGEPQRCATVAWIPLP